MNYAPREYLASAGLDVLCMADVKPTSVEWLWPNWVAIGKVSVLAGEGGRGKSTILCDLAARTTASDRWPDEAAASPAGGVIILAAVAIDAIRPVAPAGRRVAA